MNTAIGLVNPKYPHNVGAIMGDLSRVNLKLCHRFVSIPTKHCVNLAAAVYLTLYDRLKKEMYDK